MINTVQSTIHGISLYQTTGAKSAAILSDTEKNTAPQTIKTDASNTAQAVKTSPPVTATTQTQAQMIAQADDPTAVTTMLGANTNKTYDFTNMTRREISDAGKQLFKEGKITLDELFRFEHPDGKLLLNGKLPAEVSPDDRLDFVSLTRKAISDMEDTGEAQNPYSPYKMMVGLLDKLIA